MTLNARGVRLTSAMMCLNGQSIVEVDLPWANGITPSTATRILREEGLWGVGSTQGALPKQFVPSKMHAGSTHGRGSSIESVIISNPDDVPDHPNVSSGPWPPASRLRVEFPAEPQADSTAW